MTDAKPATDDEIEFWRKRADGANLGRLILPADVAPLIARIDAERARVKAMEDSLQTIRKHARMSGDTETAIMASDALTGSSNG